jgi:hypothetical protein
MEIRLMVRLLAGKRTSMSSINAALLNSYLEDSLCETETAQVEQALRQSESLRRQLQALLHERDRGEHSVGAIWCRHRLSCPSREQLGSFLLQALDEEQQSYIDFHLRTVGCAFCAANLADLKALHQEPPPKTEERRRRYFESSAGYLRPGK